MTKIAVLDDWQNVAKEQRRLERARGKAEIVFFHEAFADEDDAARQLADFDVIMAMRERTAFPATLVKRLPKLKLFSLTGKRAGSVDMQALTAQGVTITNTGGGDTGAATAELALLLMLAAARNLPQADASDPRRRVPGGHDAWLRAGGQGARRDRARPARPAHGALCQALGMEVIAWSQNLTPDAARDGGATYTPLDELLGRADVVSLHVVLSPRSRGMIGAAQLARMKQGAILVNTSRGPLVDEAALIEALRAGRITAALDVYDREPLPEDHPSAALPNTVLTPHLGYVTQSAMREFYKQSIENVLAFLAGHPIRVLSPNRP